MNTAGSLPLTIQMPTFAKAIKTAQQVKPKDTLFGIEFWENANMPAGQIAILDKLTGKYTLIDGRTKWFTEGKQDTDITDDGNRR